MKHQRYLIIDDFHDTGICGPLSELAKQYACALYITDNLQDPKLPTDQPPKQGRNRTKSNKRRNTSHARHQAPRSRTCSCPEHLSASDMSEADDSDNEPYPTRHHRVHKTPSIDSSTDSQTSSTHNSASQTPLPDCTPPRSVLETLIHKLSKVNEIPGITSPNASRTELLMFLKTFIEKILVSQQTPDVRNVESPINPAVEIQTPNESSAEILDNATDCSRSEQTFLVEEPVPDDTTQNVTKKDKLDEPMHHVVVQSSTDSNEEINDTEFVAETTDQVLSESQVQESMDVTKLQNSVAPDVVVETDIVQMESDDTTLASNSSEIHLASRRDPTGEVNESQKLLSESNSQKFPSPVQIGVSSQSSQHSINPVIPLLAPNPPPPHTFFHLPGAPPNQPILQQEGQFKFPQNLIYQPTLMFLQHQQNMINAQLMMHHKPMIAQHPPNLMNWNLIEPVRGPTLSLNSNASLSSPISQRVGGQNLNQLHHYSPVVTSPSHHFGSEVNSNMFLVHQKNRDGVLKAPDNDSSKESGYKPATGSTAAPQHVFPATGPISTVIPADIQSPIGKSGSKSKKRKLPEIECHPVVKPQMPHMINIGAGISDDSELIELQNKAIRDNLPTYPPGLYQLGRPFKNGRVRLYRKDSFERGIELIPPTQSDDERIYRQLFTEGQVLLSNLSHRPDRKFGEKEIHPSIREKMKQPTGQTVTAMHPKLHHHGVQNLHPRRRLNETVQTLQQDDNEQHKAKVARLNQNMKPVTESVLVAVYNTSPFRGQIVGYRQIAAASLDELRKKEKLVPFTRVSDYQNRSNANVELIDLTGDEEEEISVGIDTSLQNVSISSGSQNSVGKANSGSTEPRHQNVCEQKDKSMRVDQHHPTKQFIPPDYNKYDVTKTPRARVLNITPTNPYPLIPHVKRTKHKHTKIQLKHLNSIYEMYKQHKIIENDYAKLGQPIGLAGFQVKQYINNQKAADRRKERKTQKVEESKNSYGFNDNNQQ
ncbi:hypothetical protein GCK72_022769 [Caenorhabditis remanei]|uniref:Uncharacterized protein n=1 Tax=Caenorhabditis remanei TaxID=31234 RepID=A0A6A5FUX5_CAERE|nr:hypothetical protein GCK72_022769 [Caenorhabditis remanei]KAF1746316.1 hypothetical protein GCK72_022769 [Caenorhabditis remanei]